MRVTVLVPKSKFSKNVARDLLYGCWCKGKRIGGTSFPPVSLALIATVLKKDNFEAELVDAAATGMTLGNLKTALEKSQLVVVLTSSASFNEDARLLYDLKQANPILKTVVLGGFVTAEPESSLRHPGIDIVVRHEAEYIIRDLAKAMERGDSSWKQIRGISFSENGSFIHNQDYPWIENLDQLPIPDRSMIPSGADYFNPVVSRLPYTTMFTSRGCPGRCTFCFAPGFYGGKIRFNSTDKVIEELKIIRDLGYKEVFFRDEIFTFSRERTLEICRRIIRDRLDISWICSSRVDAVDFEMMKMMREAGCHMLRFGVESGVQRLLDNIEKGISLGQTRQVFEWAHRAKIDTHAHMMLGIPGETKETIKASLHFVKEINPTIVTFGILTPYAGTRLFNELKKSHPEMKDGTDINLNQLHTKSFYNEHFTDLSTRELSWYVRESFKEFYLRPGYLLKWLARLKTPGELKRAILAGVQICEFILGKN